MIDLTVLAATQDWLPWPWIQIPGVIVLIGLIIFWVKYRRSQM